MPFGRGTSGAINASGCDPSLNSVKADQQIIFWGRDTNVIDLNPIRRNLWPRLFYGCGAV